MRRVLLIVAASLPGACQRPSQQSVTVYLGAMKVSVTAPQGWTTATGSQAGFAMENFTAPGSGVVVEVMAGPLPSGVSLTELAERYAAGQKALREDDVTLHGSAGKSWTFDGARLLLVPVGERLCGIYAHGPPESLAAARDVLDRFFQSLTVEEPRFFETYERPEFGLRLKHPASWKVMQSLSGSGKAFFVSFRSPAVAVDERGTTVHATLEVNVGAVEPDLTLESFYAKRVKLLGDNYRLVEHERRTDGKAILDLYASETQLANYLEKTVYFVEGGKSYVFKFNVLQSVYHLLEPWILDIASTFEPFPVAP